MHMKPNSLSNLFRYFDLSRGLWVSNSLSMVALYKPLLHNNINMSSLQSRQLKGVRILGVKDVEFSILVKKQLILQNMFNLPTKTFQFEIKPIHTLSTLTCAVSRGASHLARLIWTKSRGRKARILGIMWNTIISGASMEVFGI